jgi:hypothetical protein
MVQAKSSNEPITQLSLYKYEPRCKSFCESVANALVFPLLGKYLGTLPLGLDRFLLGMIMQEIMYFGESTSHG